MNLSLSDSDSLFYKLFWWAPLGKVPETTPSELRRRLDSETPPQILDVRTRREYRKGHIPGAVNIPVTELRSRVGDLPFSRQRPVVAICLSAHRSIPAVRVLRAAGFRNVSHLAGGMMAWRRRKQPTVS